MTLEESLIHHLTRELRPRHRDMLRDELIRIAKVSNEIPTASVAEWDAVIDKLITQGRIIAAGERIQIDRDFGGDYDEHQPSLF